MNVLSCAWKDNRCRIGLILGTGTNACYLEDIKNIETINPDDFPVFSTWQISQQSPSLHLPSPLYLSLRKLVLTASYFNPCEQEEKNI